MSSSETTIGVSEFKPKSLALIEQVASGRLDRVVLTKRGRPVAAIVPLGGEGRSLVGALGHLMEPVPGVDLTEPSGETWAAEDG